MNKSKKFIGFRNRVQINLLEAVLNDYLTTNEFHKEEYLKWIIRYNEGTNRAEKIVSHLSTIIKRNKIILDFITKQKGVEIIEEWSKQEKKAFYTLLFCNAFPVIYDILTIVAQTLSVQESINKQVIVQKISAIYGSNRSTEIAVTEALTVLVDLELLNRTKVGIYEKTEPFQIINSPLSELIVYTDIKLSPINTATLEDLNFKPWYTYFDISASNPTKFNNLIKFQESSYGRGYLNLS